MAIGAKIKAFFNKLPRFGVNLVNGEWFKGQVRKAFNECDLDNDNQLDNKEVYIALLKLYDQINHKLPQHVKVPTIRDINALMEKYDGNANARIEFPEFLEMCKGLIGTRKNWRDSLFLKISVAVLMKSFGFPYAAQGIKAGIAALGLKEVDGLPTGALTFMLEQAVKQVTP